MCIGLRVFRIKNASPHCGNAKPFYQNFVDESTLHAQKSLKQESLQSQKGNLPAE